MAWTADFVEHGRVEVVVLFFAEFAQLGECLPQGRLDKAGLTKCSLNVAWTPECFARCTSIHKRAADAVWKTA